MPTTQNPLCPDCGVQLQADDDLWACPNCGYETDDPDNPAAGRSLDSADPADFGMGGPDSDDDPVVIPRQSSGLDYNDYVRQARGLSVDDLFANAAAKVKPPVPLPETTELEEALGTAADQALAASGSCPACGADPDQIEDGTCKACGATQPQGVKAWVVGDPEGKTHGACTELCAKVGAAQVSGRVMGERLWTPPTDTDPACFVCGDALTAVSPSAQPPTATPAPQAPQVHPGAGPGGTTVVTGVPVASGDEAPYDVGDMVQMKTRPETFGIVAHIDTRHIALAGQEIGRTVAVDLDPSTPGSGSRAVGKIEDWEVVPEDDARMQFDANDPDNGVMR